MTTIKNQGCSLPSDLDTNLCSRINVHVLMALLTVMEGVVSCIFSQHHGHGLPFLRLPWFCFFACFCAHRKEATEILGVLKTRDCDPGKNCKEYIFFFHLILEIKGSCEVVLKWTNKHWVSVGKYFWKSTLYLPCFTLESCSVYTGLIFLYLGSCTLRSKDILLKISMSGQWSLLDWVISLFSVWSATTYFR